jgi:hypothetical protein
MCSAILAHLDAGGAGLDPNVRDAIATLKTANAEAQRQTVATSAPADVSGV